VIFDRALTDKERLANRTIRFAVDNKLGNLAFAT